MAERGAEHEEGRPAEKEGRVVGRPQAPIDPEAGPVQRFAWELRELRREAGNPTYRVMSQHVPYSVTSLSQAAAGERLPTLPLALAYVRACGGEPDAWERRWHRAVEEENEHSRPDETADPPYRD